MRNRRLEQPAAAEALPACHRSRTDVVAASVFNSGLLATAKPSREGRYEYGGVPDDVWERLQRITAIAADWEVPLPAAAVEEVEVYFALAVVVFVGRPVRSSARGSRSRRRSGDAGPGGSTTTSRSMW